MLVLGILMVILFVAFPLGFLLFYRNRQVKATCEAANPGVSWVDSCPAAVLTASVWLTVMALGLLVAPFAYGGHFPLFGTLVGGLAGWGLWCVGALAGALAARGLYRCRWWGWGLGMALVLGIGVSGVMTFMRTDMREIYRTMGMVGPQIEMIERMGMLDPGYTIGTALSGLIPFLILMASALPALSRANRIR